MDQIEAQVSEAPVGGQLGLGTFLALLRRYHGERCSGVLTIRDGGARRQIFIEKGSIRSATSSRREDRLDRRLLARGDIDAEVLRRAHGEAEKTGQGFEDCLLGMGVLGERELAQELEGQVRSIVVDCFSLQKGEFQFEPTDDRMGGGTGLELSMPALLLEGIRSMEDPVALRIGVGALTDVLHPTEGARTSLPDVSAEEAFILSRVDGNTAIWEILSASPLGEVESLRSICALLAIGLVSARPAAVSEGPQRSAGSEAAKPMGAERGEKADPSAHEVRPPVQKISPKGRTGSLNARKGARARRGLLQRLRSWLG